MESERNYWISRWGDHLIAFFHDQSKSDAIRARNAESLELGTTDFPEEVLELFRIKVGPTGEVEERARFLQACHAATFQIIEELVRSKQR